MRETRIDGGDNKALCSAQRILQERAVFHMAYADFLETTNLITMRSVLVWPEGCKVRNRGVLWWSLRFGIVLYLIGAVFGRLKLISFVCRFAWLNC